MHKEHRLQSNREFRYIYRQGKSVANRQLVLYYLGQAQVPHYRLGITVSKKIGHAVVRNRIKRVLKEVVRHNEEHISPGYDLILIVRKQALHLSFWELQGSFRHVLKRAGLYRR